MTEPHAPSATDSALAARVRDVEAQLATERAKLSASETKLAELTAERDRLRRAYQTLLEHYELLRRKLFVAKAERIDAAQLALEFAETKAKLDALAKVLGDGELEGPPAPADAQPSASPPPDDDPKKTRKPKTTPTARRNLRDEDMPEKRIELLDPALEGTCERIRFEESCRQGYLRGGPVRIVLARAIYKKPVETEEGSGEEPVFELVTVKKPKELVERGLLAPSLIAHMLVSKYRFGVPRQRRPRSRRDGLRLRRSAGETSLSFPRRRPESARSRTTTASARSDRRSVPVERRGSSSAPTTTPRPPRTSSPSSSPASSTGLMPRRTSPK